MESYVTAVEVDYTEMKDMFNIIFIVTDIDNSDI